MSNIILLDMNTPSVQYLCHKDKHLSKLISMVGPISYVTHEEDAYQFLIHEIIEQMLSIKAGKKIYDHLNILCMGNISPESISALSDDEIRRVGTSNAKVEYIRNITNAVIDGTIDFEVLNNQTDEEIIKTLTRIRGIGKWTAKMFLIFVLNRQDVLPIEDGAFLQVYRWMYKTQECGEKTVSARCKKWKPYSSIAARFCYRALDSGLTKEEFHLFKQ